LEEEERMGGVPLIVVLAAEEYKGVRPSVEEEV